MLALDLAALLARVTKAPFEEVKRLQFCANMAVRGAFTADQAYSWQVSQPTHPPCNHFCSPQPSGPHN